MARPVGVPRPRRLWLAPDRHRRRAHRPGGRPRRARARPLARPVEVDAAATGDRAGRRVRPAGGAAAGDRRRAAAAAVLLPARRARPRPARGGADRRDLDGGGPGGRRRVRRVRARRRGPARVRRPPLRGPPRSATATASGCCSPSTTAARTGGSSARSATRCRSPVSGRVLENSARSERRSGGAIARRTRGRYRGCIGGGGQRGEGAAWASRSRAEFFSTLLKLGEEAVEGTGPAEVEALAVVDTEPAQVTSRARARCRRRPGLPPRQAPSPRRPPRRALGAR